MGTVWETLAVYGLQGALWFGALYRCGVRPAIVVLFFALPASWWLGELFDGNDRAVAMMLLDYGVVVALLHMHIGTHERLVALLAQVCIGIRGAYVSVHYTDHYTYAAALNCAVILQLLIAGGWCDQWGHGIDHWLDRMDPRLARAVRNLAT